MDRNDGEPNDELLRFLRETLCVSRGRLALIAGLRSREKVVQVHAPNAALALLPGQKPREEKNVMRDELSS